MQRAKGFLLIELLITLSLLSIVCVLTVANFSFLHRTVARAEVDAIYSACMLMQRRAMVANSKQSLSFDYNSQSYTFDGQKIMLPRHVSFGCMPGVKGPPANPKKEITKPITFQGQTITFQPNGIIKPGTVYFVDEDKNVMYALSSAVAQVSFLRLYHYTLNGWQLLDEV